ncbi:RNA-directed DNA polymerase (reverse transcriptase)-related family protein [Raphanus sativus]|nr:RNA-directed DNA polymerase (reverse transcriptase)-related family protein [Raphanus sativus]
MVADALREGDWCLSRSRSRNRLITLIRDSLPDSAPICSSEAEDIYLRKPGNRVASSSFSTADTWEALHPRGETVFWHRQVWFQGRIPKHAFITWDDTRQHLFFLLFLQLGDGLRWLSNPSSDEFVKLIIKLVYQAAAVILEIKQSVQTRLDPLSRAHNSTWDLV